MPRKAGAIPFRITDGLVQICLVSSKKRKHKFVLPKGTVRALEASHEAAMRETFEEAGLKGQISKKGIKIKAKSADPDQTINTIKFFPMLIDEIYNKWPEQNLRERLWVDLENLPKAKMLKRDIKVIESKQITTIIRACKNTSVA